MLLSLAIITISSLIYKSSYQKLFLNEKLELSCFGICQQVKNSFNHGMKIFTDILDIWDLTAILLLFKIDEDKKWYKNLLLSKFETQKQHLYFKIILFIFKFISSYYRCKILPFDIQRHSTRTRHK